jgi:intein/homing endonuclease
LSNPSSKNEALAWAAGFWDGEGCTTTGQRAGGRLDGTPRTKFLEIVVGQSGSDINLRRFREAVGGRGNIGGPYPREGRKDVYQWRAYGSRAGEVMLLLSPWLGEDKKEQYRQKLQEVAESKSSWKRPDVTARKGTTYTGRKKKDKQTLEQSIEKS